MRVTNVIEWATSPESVHKVAVAVVEETVAVTEREDLDVDVTNALNATNLDILRVSAKKTRTSVIVAMELDTLLKIANKLVYLLMHIKGLSETRRR
ncbi:hypothetical protein M0802_015823 [Mischocyttarus mexicanus]|nr:hypothetical protein M0802_015823 [Mischocyttarus mexicanus]